MSDVLVLCYHAVSPVWTAELSVTPEDFEHQISSLLHRGFKPATFREAALNPRSRRTLAITFDDAFASVIRSAAPILERLDACATVFVPTAFIGTSAALAWDGIDHWQGTKDAGELEPMSWAALQSLADRGWEIGSHTSTHPRLTRLDDERLAFELRESRTECARRIGSCDTVAYPYGDVDERVAQAAKDAGYLAGAALSSRLERLGPLRAPRVGIYHVDTPRRFRLKVARSTRMLRASHLWGRLPSAAAAGGGA
jgi:peptidoglycan/xylan/chitin deacetylase (PgdA/CDA1 family)